VVNGGSTEGRTTRLEGFDSRVISSPLKLWHAAESKECVQVATITIRKEWESTAASGDSRCHNRCHPLQTRDRVALAHGGNMRICIIHTTKAIIGLLSSYFFEVPTKPLYVSRCYVEVTGDRLSVSLDWAWLLSGSPHRHCLSGLVRLREWRQSLSESS
jgi:hypothetical protein